MSDFSLKTEYLTEAVRLEAVGKIGFENASVNDNIRFKALHDCGVTPVIKYNGEKINAVDSVYTLSVTNNGVLTVEAEGLSDGQNHKVGFGLNGEDLTRYNPEVFMKPVWEGNTVYHEAVMFADTADGIVQKEKKLLYPIDDVISVRNATLDKWYVKGIDFKIENGKLVFLEGGSCPFWKGNFLVPIENADSYVDPALNLGTSPNAASWYRTYDGSDKGLNLIYDGYHENCTLYVTYLHTKTWADLGETGFEHYVPESQREKVKYFYEKLCSGEEVNVLVYGASTATGCSATGMLLNYELFGREPDENGEYTVTLRKEKAEGIAALPFFEQATNRLVSKYGKNNKVNYYNIANGGTGASWGKKSLDSRVEFLDKYYGKHIVPDIIYLKFMGNDPRTSPESYRDSLESMIVRFRELYPQALIVLMGGKVNNERSYIYRDYADNVLKQQDVLAELSEKYENCVVIKATDFWRNALKSKDYEDYLSNNINHANDFWSKTTAQLIVGALS